MDRLQNTFRKGIAQARDAGQLPKNADVDALATFLMSGIQGLRLVGKANPDRAVLKNIASVMMRCIEQ
jgi:hypothetical protein